MWARIRATLRAAGLTREDLLVVGLSGGPDSLALTHSLWRGGWKIIVGHLDHGLRPNSARDADHIARLCDEWGLPCIVRNLAASEVPGKRRGNVEEESRNLRYEFLFSLADSEGAAAVLTAHTADDQVETVLMHLLRGSGLAGLAGMRPSRMMPTWSATAPLVRPMLGVWRNEVEAYCRQESLPAVDDESNRDERLLRNWVRHRLVPFLLDRYPQAKQAIERLAAIAREEDAYLAGLTRTKSRRLSSASPTGGVVVERARFAREPLAMQRRLVREWGQQMLPGWELGFEAVDEIVGWMISQEAATLQGFSGAIWGARLRDEIRLECSPEGLAGQDEFPHMEDEEFGLAAAGAYPLGRGWELQLSVVEKADGGEAETGMVLGADEARFTLDAVTVTGLTVRRRHPGDRLVPYGMKGHSVKLSDLFINAKVPGFLREGWPVVCLDGQPVWVPRLRAAAEAHFRGGPPYWRLRLARRDADG